MEQPDFGGYATRNDLKCADGLTIRSGAFQHNDGKRIPLVWQHQHNTPDNVLGHAILENRSDGVYAHAFFNDSPNAQHMKLAVQHGDINALSIYANQLRKQGDNVMHGEIQELSLVLAGANPGALIESMTIRHSDGHDETLEDEGIIYTDDELDAEPGEVNLAHSKPSTEDKLEHADTNQKEGASAMADDKTVEEVYNDFTEEQKNVVAFLVGQAAADASDDDDDKDSDAIAQSAFGGYKEGFQHAVNIFDQNKSDTEDKGKGGSTLSHAQIGTIMKEADSKFGKLSDSVLAHAGEYGITDIEFLFPDAKTVGDMPGLIARQADWVPKVLGSTKHVPFARIKSIVADITAPEARAKGYIKGTEKVDEVLSLLKRTTAPTTIYKKQRLDRDDILDITDFDVVVWLKWEIRFMLDEEVARAILIGDGRPSSHRDKIKDPMGANDGIGIRSIANDHEMYAIKLELDSNITPDEVIDEVTRSRIDYRGSGSPSYYTTDAHLVDLLLQKDKMGRRLYETEAALAAALRVKEIVPVEVLLETANLVGIIVNLIDYTVGTNRGGEVTFFSDFDIDFNQEKYLMETRLSGALTRPKSAIVITRDIGTSTGTVTQPSFNGSTNVITIPTTTGVDYTIEDEVVTAGDVPIDEDTTVTAHAKSGYFIPGGSKSWTYAYTE